MVKIEHQSSGIAKIVLVRIRKLIRKPGQQIVNLHRPELDYLADRYIDASAERHGECILSRRFVE